MEMMPNIAMSIAIDIYKYGTRVYSIRHNRKTPTT
jgi:hypothetical protein